MSDPTSLQPTTGAGTNAVLRFSDVTRVHGEGDTAVTAVAEIDLAIQPGELVAIMGRSGSGKSTLLNLAGGLDEPTSGVVLVEGEPLANRSAAELAELRRRRLGFVFQDLNLLPALTAAENVALPLELDRMRPEDARHLAADALAAVECADLGDRYPDQLSGGQRQRIAVARAFVGERKLLLADEPTGALDELAGEEIMRLIRGRCDAGAACLLVTHDAGLAAVADRVVRLRDGRVDQITERRDPDALVASLREVG